jgi:DNA repair exonuclease SbcCD nuclease subunit
MLKVLHTADWHVRDKDIEEVTKCLGFIVETARAEKVDLTTISADIFSLESTNKLDSPSTKIVIKTISDLADICPVAIITGTPSHDGLAAEILRYAKGKYPVHVSTKPEQVILFNDQFYGGMYGCTGTPDAVISQIPTPTKQFYQGTDQEVSQAMNGLFAGFGAQASQYNCPHILNGHWNISGAKLPNGTVRTGMDIEISTDQMMLAQPDLGCLGHIHIAQKLGDRFFFSGPIYSTKIDEVGPNGFWIHEFNNSRIPESRFIETPCKRTVRIQINQTDGDRFDSLPCLDVSGAAVRYEVTEWQDEAGVIDKKEITDAFMGAGALSVDIRIVAVPRETIRAAAVLEAETLKDEFSEMAKLRGEEIDPETLSMAEQLETVPVEELLKIVLEAA